MVISEIIGDKGSIPFLATNNTYNMHKDMY